MFKKNTNNTPSAANTQYAPKAGKTVPKNKLNKYGQKKQNQTS